MTYEIINIVEFPKNSNERLIPDLTKTQLKHPNRKIAKDKGETQYFTSILCRNKHLSNRWVINGACIECNNAIRLRHKQTEKFKNTTKKYTKNYKPRYRELMYGLTSEQYTAMLADQNYTCKICKNKLEEFKKTHIDHCHKTKIVRGILCHGCNLGIGFFKHNSKLLRVAALYCEQS